MANLWIMTTSFFYNDKVEQSRVELIQALNATFSREHYMIAGDVYDSNRKNLLSRGVSRNIRKDSLHRDIESIKPYEWELGP